MAAPSEASLIEAVGLIGHAERITLLVGKGARAARGEVLELAQTLLAPMVLTLKAKEVSRTTTPTRSGKAGSSATRQPNMHSTKATCC